jgi:hypothetical protein
MEEIKYYKHQTDLIALNPKKYLLPWSCGSGKTYGLIGLIKKNNLQNKPVLLITIKSDKEKWVKILEKFEINATVLTKEEFKKATTKQVLKKAFDKKLGYAVEMKKTVVNPAGLPKHNFVVVDEVHFLALGTSMMNKSLMAYLKLYQPEYIWIATATPCDNNFWRLYYLGNILGYDWNYNRFRNHFFSYIRQFGPRGVWVPKKIIDGRPAEVEIARYINFLGRAVKIEDCIDIPPKVYIEEYFDLTAEQKKAIREVNEPLAMTENLKIHQICGGTLHEVKKDENGAIIEEKFLQFKCNKLDRIVELCQEHKKLFIVCKYKAEIKAVQAILSDKGVRKPVYTFTGENSSQRKEFSEKADKENECVVIANAACSAAYEVPTIPLMVFYSYDWSLINYVQIQDRIRRINNPAPRTYLSLICKNSIDEKVFEAMQNKCDFDSKIYKRDK